MPKKYQLTIIKVTLIFCSIFISCVASKQEAKQPETKKNSILIFSKTNTFRHKSIPDGIAALKKLGVENNWHVDATEDSLQFNYNNLKKYNTIVFLNTTGNVLGTAQEKAFVKYIHEGGGYLGIHAASDTEHGWKFYTDMVGAQFKSHPKQQTAIMKVYKNDNHPAIAHFGETFTHFDEWYNFKKPVVKHANILLELDESSYTGKRMGTKHPISWYHHYEGGRIFYTGMGHTKKSYTNKDFLQHVKEGLKWTMKETNVPIDEEGENLLDKDLSRWDVWMGAVHTSVDLGFDFEKSTNVKKGKPLGLNNDPKKVFSVIEEDGEPILHITGEIYGGLTTKNEYDNYHFSAKFKWGEKKWEPRLKDKRDSGLLYHAKGVHGAFWNVWKASLEYQVQEGDCGDFIALGDVYGDVPAERFTNDKGKFKKYVYNPKGKNYPIKGGTPGFETAIVKKSELYENPNGEWNTIEIYVLGNESIHLVNGKVVNRVKNARYNIGGKTVPATLGKIQLQSEAAEIFYKEIKIKPIKKFPKKYRKQ